MDNSGTLPPEAALYQTPLRGRLAVQGLQGATAADLIYGGMPERLGSFGSAGDAGEGIDLPNPATPASARGEGPSYQPHPYLPRADHLDYVHKFTSTSLLTIGLVLVLLVLLRSPRTAGNLLARGGLKQAGIA
jgi:hypothetical protein